MSHSELSAKRIIKVSASVLAQVMVGDISCIWNPWVQARFVGVRGVEAGSGLLKWKMEHTYHLDQLEAKYRGHGIPVQLEGQNAFDWTLTNGIILTGKPDAIAIPPNRPPVISDIKTGQQKDWHRVQVMIYMLGIPLVREEYKDTNPCGYLIYSERKMERIDHSEITEEFMGKLLYWSERIGSSTEPMRRPSRMECRFCNVAKNVCPDRVEWEQAS